VDLITAISCVKEAASVSDR